MAGPTGEDQFDTGPAAAPRRLTRTVALVGLMGAGKSSIGRRLAAQIGAQFRDLDEEIERAAGLSIPEIFDHYGEQHFRDGEQRVIMRLLELPPHILATGGGAYMREETRRALREKAHALWLKADLETLVARCARKANRPLLKKGDPRQILGRLIDARYPVYAEADTTIESRGGPHEAVVREALEALERVGAVVAAEGDAS